MNNGTRSRFYDFIDSCYFESNKDEYVILEHFLKKHIKGALIELYDFLETQKIFHFSAAKRKVLIQKQSQHWIELLLSADINVVREKSIQIGQKHDEHNISSELYILGYKKIITYLQNKVFEDHSTDPQRVEKILNHITNRTLIDISISLSSYIDEREKHSTYFYHMSRASSRNNDFKEAIVDMLLLTLRYIGMDAAYFHNIQSDAFLKKLDDLYVNSDGEENDTIYTYRRDLEGDFSPKIQDLKSKKSKCLFLRKENFSKKSKKLTSFFKVVKTCLFIPIKISNELVAVIEFFSFKGTEDHLLSRKAIEIFSSQLSIVLERLHLFTTQEKFIKSLHHAAFYDSLTGLANRDLFVDRLHHNLKNLSRIDSDKSSVIFLDVDDFKDINDKHGHALGDETLKIIAKSISACVRQSDTVSRFGGDEFVVLLDSVEDEGEAYEIAERILENCCRTFYLENTEVKNSVSIGLLMLDSSHEQEDNILYKADKAMYKAKKLGKGRICVFDSQFVEKINSEIKMLKDLEEAIKTDDIEMYYQPIVDIKSGRIAYFEALCRWHHPELGSIPPAIFIKLAESSGLILDLGKKCFELCSRDMENLRKTLPDYPGAIFSINMSVKQFHNDKHFNSILKLIQNSPNPTSSLKVEVTESLLLDSTKETYNKFMKLKNMGVEVLIDDFGTGYSSLSYLNKFDFDYLKIDKIFVDKMTVDSKNLELIKAIIALSKSQNIDVIAEGIEHKEQLDMLYEMGCYLIQGYYFSRPLPLVETLLLISKEMAHKNIFENLQNQIISKNKVISIRA